MTCTKVDLSSRDRLAGLGRKKGNKEKNERVCYCTLVKISKRRLQRTPGHRATCATRKSWALGMGLPRAFSTYELDKNKNTLGFVVGLTRCITSFHAQQKREGGAFFFYFWTATRTSVASFWFGCIVPQPVVADYLFVLQRYGGLFFFYITFFFWLSGRRDLAYFEAFCRVQYFFYFLF